MQNLSRDEIVYRVRELSAIGLVETRSMTDYLFCLSKEVSSVIGPNIWKKISLKTTKTENQDPEDKIKWAESSKMSSFISAGIRHQREAKPIHLLIVVINGILALGCIGGGTYAVAVNALSKSEIDIFGLKVSTGSVGVAFVAIGLIIAYQTVKVVLKNQHDLAALSSDRDRERKRRK